MTPWRELDDRLRDVLSAPLPRDRLAEAVYAEVARYVPYSFGCLATTDPASGVVTWVSKTRPLGMGDEEWSALEYGGPDVNLLADLARRDPPVGALGLDTGGHPETCRRHRELMVPRFGFTDELRAVFVRRGATWGALGLYRGAGEPAFSAAEVDRLAGAVETVAVAIQRSLFLAPSGPAAADDPGPAVVIVGADDRITHLTPAARAAVEELGGWDHGSLPATVLSVVATARAGGRPVTSRTVAESGRWVSVRATSLGDAPERGTGGGHGDVVVSLEATSRAALSRLALAAHGLTTREEDVALLVLQGVDTRGIASALHLSPHTVQDHLKAVFAKVGVRSRRELSATLLA